MTRHGDVGRNPGLVSRRDGIHRHRPRDARLAVAVALEAAVGAVRGGSQWRCGGPTALVGRSAEQGRPRSRRFGGRPAPRGVPRHGLCLAGKKTALSWVAFRNPRADVLGCARSSSGQLLAHAPEPRPTPPRRMPGGVGAAEPVEVTAAPDILRRTFHGGDWRGLAGRQLGRSRDFAPSTGRRARPGSRKTPSARTFRRQLRSTLGSGVPGGAGIAARVRSARVIPSRINR